MATWTSQAGETFAVSDEMALCLTNLQKRGFVTRYYPTVSAARAAMLAEIRPEEVVGIGGSKTIDELDVFDALVERGNSVLWHWRADEAEGDVRPQALLSDCYLCSANALMDSGELVSIDGRGNRVAAMFYGPTRCIIVCGQNKLVTGGYDAAIERIKTVACPQNARRLNMKTPCAKTDRCYECAADLRMCRVTVRYSYPMGGRETHVWVVGEDMGY
ncbi:MAG: lactate utilization protein [Ruminococcaceae bacterium]|nr:lactate utilization protein [Oscillospiraceae bacterium]